MSKTHYDNLKVTKNAPDYIIKAAYRALSQRFHPDVFKGPTEEAERIMKIVNAAKDVLCDPKKRAAYDKKIKDENEVCLRYENYYNICRSQQLELYSKNKEIEYLKTHLHFYWLKPFLKCLKYTTLFFSYIISIIVVAYAIVEYILF